MRRRPERDRAGGLGVGLGSSPQSGAVWLTGAWCGVSDPRAATGTRPGVAPPPFGGGPASKSARAEACAREVLHQARNHGPQAPMAPRCPVHVGPLIRRGLAREPRARNRKAAARRAARTWVKKRLGLALRARAPPAERPPLPAAMAERQESCAATACARRGRPPSRVSSGCQTGGGCCRARRQPSPLGPARGSAISIFRSVLFLGQSDKLAARARTARAQTPAVTAHAHGGVDGAAGVACARTASVECARLLIGPCTAAAAPPHNNPLGPGVGL